MEEAVTSLLHALGDDSILTRDFNLIGCLVGKLPTSYVDMWDDYLADSGCLVNWGLFTAWLKKARGRASAAKNRELSTRLNNRQEEKKATPRSQGLGAGNINLEGGEDKNACRSAGEAAAEEATKRAKPCPMCVEQGRTKRIHTYQRFFARSDPG